MLRLTIALALTGALAGCGGDSAALDRGSDSDGGASGDFPADFPRLVDTGGFGAGETLGGFGGDLALDREAHRRAIRHRPVILLHGNGAHAEDPTFGMEDLRDRLLDAGYAPAEIWAPSYLGQDVALAEVPTPHRNNIADVRRFIDEVIDYLDVDRVDLVGHSLGCGMINGYLRGLRTSGNFVANDQRFDRVGTVVCLGGAVYGTGAGALYAPEFDTDGAFVRAGLDLDGVEDATPYGAVAVSAMSSPVGELPGGRPFDRTTAVDGGERRIYYVALWAIGDFVDSGLPNTGGMQGADLNRGFELPSQIDGVLTAELARHAHLVHDRAVFDALAPYLDR